MNTLGLSNMRSLFCDHRAALRNQIKKYFVYLSLEDYYFSMCREYHFLSSILSLLISDLKIAFFKRDTFLLVNRAVSPDVDDSDDDSNDDSKDLSAIVISTYMNMLFSFSVYKTEDWKQHKQKT